MSIKRVYNLPHMVLIIVVLTLLANSVCLYYDHIIERQNQHVQQMSAPIRVYSTFERYRGPERTHDANPSEPDHD